MMDTTAWAEYTFQCLVVTVLGIVCLRAYREQIVVAGQMRLRFKLFDLRDQLLELAVRKKISGESEEFQYILHNLNALLRYQEELGLLKLVRALAMSVESAEQERLLTSIKRNDCLARIYMRSIEAVMEAVVRNSFLIRAIRGLMIAVSTIGSAAKPLRMISLYPKLERVSADVSEIEEFSKNLKAYC